MKDSFLIAYFSMEAGIHPDMPTYSGGLGILAGDTIKAAADLGLPFVAVTLVSRRGYFQQELDESLSQQEHHVAWEPSERMKLQKPRVSVSIQGRKVALAAWRLDYVSSSGGTVPVFFLDTDLPENNDEDRTITHFLYGGDDAYRLKAEVVLGIGGYRMLEALGFRPRRYHLNEGHAALLTVELLRETKRSLERVWDERLVWDPAAVRDRVIFTTHTPVAAGHDRFSWDLVREVLGEPIPLDLFREFAGQDCMNNTLLAMNLSGYINGVAKKHRDVSRSMFAGYTISAVTNGVHSLTWTHARFQKLYDEYLPGWREEPGLLAWIEKVPDELVWQAHQAAKADLFEYLLGVTGVSFNPDVLTMGFARRATGYKRADLLFTDLEKLKTIAGARLQLVFAGKAHPRDEEGKDLIRQVGKKLGALSPDVRSAYLPDYDMRQAMILIPGVDLWLNTPLRPLEASGTSGMKAAHNGVPNFSVLDGWWVEGHLEGLTGWSIGPKPDEPMPEERATADLADAADLYDKLENLIMPLYYNDRAGWIRVMKGAIGKNAYYFNAHRMMRRYVTEAYIRSPASSR